MTARCAAQKFLKATLVIDKRVKTTNDIRVLTCVRFIFSKILEREQKLTKCLEGKDPFS